VAKAKGKAPPARWLREAQGVVALGLAAYVTVALLSYDSTLHWLDQGGRVGVVGLWIGWAMFTAVGYAGYLVPLALVGARRADAPHGEVPERDERGEHERDRHQERGSFHARSSLLSLDPSVLEGSEL